VRALKSDRPRWVCWSKSTWPHANGREELFTPVVVVGAGFGGLEAVRRLRGTSVGCVYGEAFTRRTRAMGIRDRPTAPRSPWQNGYAERLIGSIRRECLDHVVIIGERHLRHVLRSYQQYYNGTRTHLSLAKDSPLTRSVQPRGTICPLPILGGLHHHYVRI